LKRNPLKMPKPKKQEQQVVLEEEEEEELEGKTH